MISKVYSLAYSKTQEVFEILSHPFVIHLLLCMETKKDWEVSSLMAGRSETPAMCYKYLRRMLDIQLVRRTRFGNEYTYTLNHAKLEEYNAIAARTIGAATATTIGDH